MRVTPCQCPLSGFCERHKVNKSPLLHSKCQTDERFWHAWEQGRGPRTIPESESIKAKRKKQADAARAKAGRLVGWLKRFRAPEDKGVGDTAERWLARIGGRKIKSLILSLGGTCGCKDRQKWLNKKFPY